MQLLKEISDSTLGLEDVKVDKYKLRRCARGIILNSKEEIALMYVKKLEYYELSGGGVED